MPPVATSADSVGREAARVATLGRGPRVVSAVAREASGMQAAMEVMVVSLALAAAAVDWEAVGVG